MFSYTTNIKRAHYSIHSGAVHVYYDDDQKFGASLDILTDPESTKPDSFASLAFTYHNKSSSSDSTILFSLMNNAENLLTFRLSDNVNKFIVVTMNNSTSITSHLVSLTHMICRLRVACDQYMSNDDSIERSRKLLSNFTTALRCLLNSDQSEKNILDTLIKISNCLELEIKEFENTVNINTVNSPSADDEKKLKPF